MFTEDLCGNVFDYYTCYIAGVAWEFDEELMRRHGFLRNTAFGGLPSVKMLSSREGWLSPRLDLIDAGPDRPTADSLTDYLDWTLTVQTQVLVGT